MPTPPLRDEVLIETVTAYRECGTQSGVARCLGIARDTVQNRLKIAAARGFLLQDEGGTFEVKSRTVTTDAGGALIRQSVRTAKAPGPQWEAPAGHTVKGYSTLLDGEGRTTAQWVKTQATGPDPVDIVEAIKAAFDGYEAPQRVSAPLATDADLLTFLPLSDLHIGLHAWSATAGANWDLKIAENVIGRNVEDLVDRTPPSGHAIVLGGGDLLHNDNNENKTARSGNVLDVDGRWPKILMTACRLVVRIVDAMLRRHERVTVRLLAGNHDEHSSTAVAYFLLAWYRHEDRVTVDADPSLFFWHRFGKVMLGSTHGHAAKIEDMAGIMAHRRPEDWGATRHRYCHGFHLHRSSKIMTEGGGVISEVHQTPTPQDAWAFGSGYLSGRSMQAITYHSAFGEVSRSRIAIVDDEAAF